MGYHYPFNIDRESGVLSFNYEYYIPTYNDPETGEQFDQTYWTLTITEPGVSSGAISDYAGESGQVWMDSYLLGGNDVHTYVYDLQAFNTFSAVSISARWTMILAAFADTALDLAGGEQVDVLIGGLVNDVLRGNGGNDILDGGEGADRLEGGAGYDRLDGGLGDDTLLGGDGDDIYFVDSTGDVVVETATGGSDLVYAEISHRLAVHVESLVLAGVRAINGTGNGGNNLIVGNGASNVLRGQGGNDMLRGEGGDDHLLGGSGDDTLIGGTGADTVDGGAGHDTYYIDEFDTIVETEADYVLSIDTVITAAHMSSYTLGTNLEILQTGGYADFHGIGNSGRNGLYGGVGDDLLQGLGGSDALYGGVGDDRLEGGEGADELRGGDGRDTAVYSNSAAGVYVNLALDSQVGGDAEGDWLLGIEDVVGSEHNDTLIGILTDNTLDGGAGDDTLFGSWGNDQLIGGTGADQLDGGDGIDTLDYSASGAGVRINLAVNTATGGDATGDTITNFENVIGSDFRDVLRGDAGANILRGQGGDDRLYGGGGNDTLQGGIGADWLDGQGGSNRVSYAGSVGAVTVDLATDMVSGGDAEGDRIFNMDHVDGGRGADHLYGNEDANKLSGGGRNDQLYGRGGNDTLRGGVGADRIDGGDGQDTVSYVGSTGQVVVYLNNGFGTYGDASGDTYFSIENVQGGDGNDYILGDDNGNRIKGGAGFDYLDGGAGNDFLTGGENGDTFRFHTGHDRDVITDFVQGQDQVFIDFDGGFFEFDQLSSLISATGPGGIHSKIDFGGGDVLIIQNVLAANLTAADFSFLIE